MFTAEQLQNVDALYARIEKRDGHILNYIIDNFIDNHLDFFDNVVFKDDPEYWDYQKAIQEMYDEDRYIFSPEQYILEMQYDWCLAHPIEVLRYYYYKK